MEKIPAAVTAPESDPNPAPAPGSNGLSRRSLMKRGGWFAAVATFFGVGTAVAQKSVPVDDETLADTFGAFFQKHYKVMNKEEMQAALGRIERRVRREHGVAIKVGAEPPIPGVVYGYAINLSKCKGTRRCVEACMAENNQSRDSQIQYIRVLEMDRGTMDLTRSEPYYDGSTVPKKDKFYLPIQCMQCDDSPCTRACPVQATWTEPDGITVVDYDWCIGCRYCMTTCPYWARHFNWNEPKIKPEEINTDTHYLGNRPRQKGVMEKCTFCIQRTRKGRQPACLEACPTGARVFGNLLDPASDIRYVLENKRVFRLKEELGTEPKFWYYTD
jgi:molybdopterin-containing oxidoreductase family iron-sulfur binding subunit